MKFLKLIKSILIKFLELVKSILIKFLELIKSILIKFLELIKSIKVVYKAFLFSYFFSSIVIEIARTTISYFLKHVLRKQKEKTKLLFI